MICGRVLMLVLGIDTATWFAGVGLAENGQVVLERSRRAASSHAEILVPLADELLGEAGVSWDKVDGVAISIGPGSFTGLRIGLSFIKGIAYARGLPVAAVPTLDALAASVAASTELICPMLDARKGEVYTALYRESQPGQREKLTHELVISPVRLLSMITTSCLFIGDGVELYGELVTRSLGKKAHLWPFDGCLPRGGMVALLGGEKLCRGEDEEIGQLAPRYIRPSDAELRRV